MSAILILESENRGCEPSVFRPGLFSTTSDSFYFNPRSPCGERPKTGVTAHRNAYFNPRSPCGERHCPALATFDSICISIHAPRVGSDFVYALIIPPTPRFQSTLPVWGATGIFSKFLWRLFISIHAPRVGSDRMSCNPSRRPGNFNPRSPCGERRCAHGAARGFAAYFNPRSPCGERRRACGGQWGLPWISIHAPRVGSDLIKLEVAFANFISIHAPRVGSDPWAFREQKVLPAHFNPRSPCGERPSICGTSSPGRYFNPRSPCGERLSLCSAAQASIPFQSTRPVWGATTRLVF